MERKEDVFEEIKEEHLDMMIRFALKQAEAEGLLNNNSIDVEPITEDEVRRTYDLFLQKWNDFSELRIRDARRQRIKRILRTGIRVMVCFILCLVIATPIAIANIAPLREYIARMLINTKEDHTEIALTGINNDSIPEDWNGKYYPLSVPGRYHLARINSFPITAVFQDDNNNMLYYTEGDQNEGIDIDSENASTRYEIIGTKEVLVVEKEGFTTFVWHNDECLFTISGIMSTDEAKNMMESTVRVY